MLAFNLNINTALRAVLSDYWFRLSTNNYLNDTFIPSDLQSNGDSPSGKYLAQRYNFKGLTLAGFEPTTFGYQPRSRLHHPRQVEYHVKMAQQIG